ncbi:Uncharacterized protein PECH_005368 [Penicillium ucsense]|uniref:Uncharacterized protein n=1 Tax=Penicillium ucsense TaxID=2839758 RepID=A0A8J8WJ22_9EURO|nr:Uncharacterized protein PECM_007634 [Penicillium ucsense]KAF7736394.1 Uncharacterized protein PECH_005368 [Penicillium ucsense]
MDSMRSLNTSLPASTPRPQPSEQLLQSFKAAALSVTNLYKNAVCDQARARSAGYQDAIEDLLHFLDKENLGLDDGEGWTVRQWATAKCDGTGSLTGEDDDRVDSEKSDTTTASTKTHADSSSPETLSRQLPVPGATAVTEPSSQPDIISPTPQTQETAASSTMFTFTAGPTFPQYQDLDMDMQPTDDSKSPLPERSPVNVPLIPRTPRPQRHAHSHAYVNSRTPQRETPTHLGSKRKLPLPDFFDFSDLSSGKDNLSNGGKRGRFA